MQQYTARKISASGTLLRTEHPRYATNHRRITILLIEARKQCDFIIESITILEEKCLLCIVVKKLVIFAQCL
jgi:hypothetical protein